MVDVVHYVCSLQMEGINVLAQKISNLQKMVLVVKQIVQQLSLFVNQHINVFHIGGGVILRYELFNIVVRCDILTVRNKHLFYYITVFTYLFHAQFLPKIWKNNRMSISL